MDSTARFLLGGALGAALGYLLSQKNLEKALESGQLSVSVSAHPTPQGAESGRLATQPSPVSPVAAAVTPPATLVTGGRAGIQAMPPGREGEWTIPPAPPADWRPVEEPAPATAAEAAPTAAPSVRSTAAPDGVLPSLDVTAPSEPSDSEVIVTRDFLEEPIPGSGWRSSTPPAPVETREDAARIGSSIEWAVEEAVAELPVEEAVVELPVIEERVVEVTGSGSPPVPAPSGLTATPLEEAVFTGAAPVDAPSRVDDLKSRIEETRRRIRHELEQPFDTAVTSRSAERDWTTPTEAPPAAQRATGAEPAVSLVATEPIAVEALVVTPQTVVLEPPVGTTATMEQVALEEVVVEPIPIETVVVEEVAVEPAAVEPAAAEPAAAEVAALEPVATETVVTEDGAPEAILIEPIAAEPALLEETAAPPTAIEPVMVPPNPIETATASRSPVEAVAVERAAVETGAAEAPTEESAAVEPIAAEPVAFEPPTVEPAIEAPVARGAVESEGIAGSVEVAAETEPAGAEVELGLDEPVDYDSMKDRIETTRSRLKAKAFDAMMTGESALLGRDVGGTGQAMTRMPGVDSDIDQTIETSLREEEE